MKLAKTTALVLLLLAPFISASVQEPAEPIGEEEEEEEEVIEDIDEEEPTNIVEVRALAVQSFRVFSRRLMSQ